NHAITGTSMRELGAPRTPDDSFELSPDDTIASAVAAYDAVCADSRQRLAAIRLEDELTGRGTRTLWSVYLHFLREIAQHCGHADILREQVLAARESRVGS